MQRTLVIVVLAAVAIYGAFKALPLLSGPSITLAPFTSTTGVENPSPGFITISGIATHTETLTMNGSILLIDKAGAFSKSLTLPPGGAILSLTATDRFGRSRTTTETVYVP